MDQLLDQLPGAVVGSAITAATAWLISGRMIGQSKRDALADRRFDLYSRVILAARLMPHEMYRAMDDAYGEGKSGHPERKAQIQPRGLQSHEEYKSAHQAALIAAPRLTRAALDALEVSVAAAVERYRMTFGVDPSLRFWDLAAEPILIAALRVEHAIRAELGLPD